MDYKIKERILKNMLIGITNKYDYIIGEYRALGSQYKEKLLKDSLTGVFNRDGFMKELNDIYKRCEEKKRSME
ncbi:MAG: hypothetical protein N2Z80_01160 [Hydrogenothermaceae bacterium]|nr:hypothetical protein [Hydrogenothermaceae bacterium]